ncbi:MAG: hypothetical protein Kow0059_16260 [Candidatus Sumerlaeia bacterium]
MQRVRLIRGFTLIELLIVVAIIAILAAIAVPNFLEAQTRSKVSRAKADLRTLATALESYAVDNNRYPPDQLCYSQTFGSCSQKAPSGSNLEPFMSYSRLTTPVAYISTIPINVFPNKTDQPGDITRGLYRYFGVEWRDLALLGHPTWPKTGFLWTLVSSGPNGKSNLGEYMIFGEEFFHTTIAATWPTEQIWGGIPFGPAALYDPTNGTISEGDVISAGPGNRMF